MSGPMLAALLAVAAVGGAPDRAPTVSDPVRGLDLWRGARIGMDQAQVHALFPAAVPPGQPVMLTGGEVDRLQLPGVDVAGQPAVAHFYFKDGGLTSVQLQLPALAAGRSAQNLRLARGIAARLGAIYGQGYDCGDRSFSQIAAYGCKWLRKPLSVRLWYMDTAGQAPLLYVAYRQADDPGYNL